MATDILDIVMAKVYNRLEQIWLEPRKLKHGAKLSLQMGALPSIQSLEYLHDSTDIKELRENEPNPTTIKAFTITKEPSVGYLPVSPK